MDLAQAKKHLDEIIAMDYVSDEQKEVLEFTREMLKGMAFCLWCGGITHCRFTGEPDV